MEKDSSNINQEFTFESFIEVESNRIARYASIQVGENPGRLYNPLFIHGGVGLGKTHLMHAVGNMIKQNNPAARVLCLHSDDFVTEMVKALKHGTMDQLMRRMLSVNALLIDDVHFFAGKEHSQEEFFHIFEALLDLQRQIILTIDHFTSFYRLEDRLVSIFNSGLTVFIEPLDLEARVAILMSKAQQLFNLELSHDVAVLIATHLRSDIRELEGMLRRLNANAQITGRGITLEFAHEALVRDGLLHN